MAKTSLEKKRAKEGLSDGKITSRSENTGGTRYGEASDRLGTKGTLMAKHEGVKLPPSKTKKHVDTQDADLQKAIDQANKQGGTDNLGPYIVTPSMIPPAPPVMVTEVKKPDVFDVRIHPKDKTFMVYSPMVLNGTTLSYMSGVGEWKNTGIKVENPLYVILPNDGGNPAFCEKVPSDKEKWSAYPVADVVTGKGVTSYIQGALVIGGGGGGGGGGTNWGWGHIEWDKDSKAFVQYLGTFAADGTFSCYATEVASGCGTKMEYCKKVVIEVISHVCDHTAGVV